MSSKKYEIITSIKATNRQLNRHPIYSVLDSIHRIKAFVVYYNFDTWDRTKLIESIQNRIELSSLAKTHKYHHELRRSLEETFLRPGELYPNYQPKQSFTSYLRAVLETDREFNFHLCYFLEAPNNSGSQQTEIKALVKFNSSVAKWGTISEIIAVLFLGHKKLDFQTFIEIVQFSNREAKECPSLLEYIEKLRQYWSSQSELVAFELLNYFCHDEAEQIRALQTGLKVLRLRKQLLDYALVKIRNIHRSDN